MSRNSRGNKEHAFLEACRMRAAEELEAELQEESLFDEDEEEEDQQVSKSRWRAGIGGLLSGILPGRKADTSSKENTRGNTTSPNASALSPKFKAAGIP